MANIIWDDRGNNDTEHWGNVKVRINGDDYTMPNLVKELKHLRETNRLIQSNLDQMTEQANIQSAQLAKAQSIFLSTMESKQKAIKGYYSDDERKLDEMFFLAMMELAKIDCLKESMENKA